MRGNFFEFNFETTFLTLFVETILKLKLSSRIILLYFAYNGMIVKIFSYFVSLTCIRDCRRLQIYILWCLSNNYLLELHFFFACYNRIFFDNCYISLVVSFITKIRRDGFPEFLIICYILHLHIFEAIPFSFP